MGSEAGNIWHLGGNFGFQLSVADLSQMHAVMVVVKRFAWVEKRLTELVPDKPCDGAKRKVKRLQELKASWHIGLCDQIVTETAAGNT